MRKTVTLRMDEKDAATVEMVARADGTTVSEIIRTALDAHIDQRRADKGFQARLEQILEEDRLILERLAK